MFLIDSGARMTIIPESCAQGLVGSGEADLWDTGKTFEVKQSVCA